MNEMAKSHCSSYNKEAYVFKSHGAYDHAFFVNKKYREKFEDIPKNINDIFYPADYNWFITSGHAASPKTIEYFANIKK